MLQHNIEQRLWILMYISKNLKHFSHFFFFLLCQKVEQVKCYENFPDAPSLRYDVDEWAHARCLVHASKFCFRKEICFSLSPVITTAVKLSFPRSSSMMVRRKRSSSLTCEKSPGCSGKIKHHSEMVLMQGESTPQSKNHQNL